MTFEEWCTLLLLLTCVLPLITARILGKSRRELAGLEKDMDSLENPDAETPSPAGCEPAREAAGEAGHL